MHRQCLGPASVPTKGGLSSLVDPAIWWRAGMVVTWTSPRYCLPFLFVSLVPFVHSIHPSIHPSHRLAFFSLLSFSLLFFSLHHQTLIEPKPAWQTRLTSRHEWFRYLHCTFMIFIPAFACLHAYRLTLHAFTPTPTHVIDMRRQTQPARSNWNTAEDETSFWGYEASAEQHRASRGWASHDERASNSGRDSLDESWFTNDTPAPRHEYLGTKSSLDDQGYE